MCSSASKMLATVAGAKITASKIRRRSIVSKERDGEGSLALAGRILAKLNAGPTLRSKAELDQSVL